MPVKLMVTQCNAVGDSHTQCIEAKDRSISALKMALVSALNWLTGNEISQLANQKKVKVGECTLHWEFIE